MLLGKKGPLCADREPTTGAPKGRTHTGYPQEPQKGTLNIPKKKRQGVKLHRGGGFSIRKQKQKKEGRAGLDKKKQGFKGGGAGQNRKWEKCIGMPAMNTQNKKKGKNALQRPKRNLQEKTALNKRQRCPKLNALLGKGHERLKKANKFKKTHRVTQRKKKNREKVPVYSFEGNKRGQEEKGQSRPSNGV